MNIWFDCRETIMRQLHLIINLLDKVFVQHNPFFERPDTPEHKAEQTMLIYVYQFEQVINADFDCEDDDRVLKSM